MAESQRAAGPPNRRQSLALVSGAAVLGEVAAPPMVLGEAAAEIRVWQTSVQGHAGRETVAVSAPSAWASSADSGQFGRVPITPTGLNLIWQLVSYDFETIAGGMWRIAKRRDSLRKVEPL